MDVPLGLSCVMARLGKEAGERVAEGGGQSVWLRNLSLALKSSGSFSFLNCCVLSSAKNPTDLLSKGWGLGYWGSGQ